MKLTWSAPMKSIDMAYWQIGHRNVTNIKSMTQTVRSTGLDCFEVKKKTNLKCNTNLLGLPCI